MYEIPPSVDWYLRTSSKSMIHYPAIAFENQSSTKLEHCKAIFKSASEDEVTSLNGHEENVLKSFEIVGKFRSSLSNNKRKFEDVQHDHEGKRMKSFHGDDYYSREDLAALNQTSYYPHQNGQCIEKLVTKQTFARSHQGRTTISETNQDYKGIKILTNKLPKIKPRLNGEINSSDKIQTNTYNGKIVSRNNPWGPESYSDLISKAIGSFPNNRATLQHIYEWIVSNVPHFADKADYPSTKGWKNAIRHTLSIRKRFTRIVNESTPHSSLWTFSKNANKAI